MAGYCHGQQKSKGNQIERKPFLGELLQDKDAGKSERVMKAMLQMKKIDIKRLKQAYEQQ